uniref:ZP domain-containing protein n=1 Tax=Parastrongyloides trichosuri TaxID=131310 RepID=A0A0N4ZPY7_PARTI
MFYTEPTITCTTNAIIFTANTSQSFNGKVFVKGYSMDNNCFRNGKKSKNIKISLNFESCGIRRSREINGLSVSTTIIISFHPMFITKVDRAFKVNCFYTEPIKKVAQKLNVSDVVAENININAPLPMCKYEILEGSNSGKPIRFARIGDIVYHKWSCSFDKSIIDTPKYCMLVHSCLVNDGQGGEEITVIDDKGCEVDGYILRRINYVNDMEGGQFSNVFKFADKNSLVFNCQISLTIKDINYGCEETQPKCISSASISNNKVSETKSDGEINNYERANDISNYNNDNQEMTSESSYDNGIYKTNPSFYYGVTEVPPSVFEDEDINTTDGGEEYIINGVKTISQNISMDQRNREIKRRIRKTRKVVDFDLPEQTLIVLGIEDTLPTIPSTSSKFYLIKYKQ